VTLLSSKSRTDRQTDRQTHRAYKGLQVPPFNLTVNVGNDKSCGLSNPYSFNNLPSLIKENQYDIGYRCPPLIVCSGVFRLLLGELGDAPHLDFSNNMGDAPPSFGR